MSENSQKNRLLVFLKYPKPGSVKTRLARNIGKGRATTLYKHLVERILSNTKSKNYQRIVYFTPKKNELDLKKWLGGNIEYRLQKGKDLGQRLSNAFRESFLEGAKKIVAIGTDSPLVDRKTVMAALNALSENDTVIGPALDGGYYLVGLSGFDHRIFENINWGTDSVFCETMMKIKRFKISCKVLEKTFDIDRVEDLKML